MENDPSWAAYLRVQKRLSTTTNIVRARALEEVATSLLEAIAAGRTLDSKQIANLERGRIRKQWKRDAILRERAELPATYEHTPAPVILDFDTYKNAVAPNTWRILMERYAGQPYSAISDKTGQSVSAMKSEVKRARDALRLIAA